MSSSPVGPQSEQDWTIHSLNIHGIFFERWCQQVINSQRDCWTVTTTNYPVQVAGHQSNLDIRADLRVGDRRLLLNIECKKNNPEFVDWVFFLKAEGIGSGVLLPHIEIHEGQGPLVRVAIQPLVLRAPTIQFVNDARETRGNYQSYKGQNKTKTSNAAITEAAMQIALATASVYAEEPGVSGPAVTAWSLARSTFFRNVHWPEFPRSHHQSRRLFHSWRRWEPAPHTGLVNCGGVG